MIYWLEFEIFVEDPGGGGGYSPIWLYRDVPLDRVWFLARLP